MQATHSNLKSDVQHSVTFFVGSFHVVAFLPVSTVTIGATGAVPSAASHFVYSSINFSYALAIVTASLTLSQLRVSGL